MMPALRPKHFFSLVLLLMLLTLPAAAQEVSQVQDTAAAWDNDTAVHIVFTGDTVDIFGEGATLNNGVITISKSGAYVLSGKWNNGQLNISAGKEDIVHLIMNGASIHCAGGAPLSADRAGKVIITLVQGTENTLSDEGSYNPGNGDADAALYVQDDLTINGRGALAVTAAYKHGIVSKDDLLIEGGLLTVTAADVGIRGRDFLKITGGEITVTSQGDALQANNDEDAQKGRILLSGGIYNLTSGKDGIQAESTLDISGGIYTLCTGPEKPETEDGVGKGLKAGTALTISGGIFTMQCADNALHAKGAITVKDGQFQISTGGDALHSNGSVIISGGEFAIEKSYDGMDAAAVLITGGNIRIAAEDDGLHAAITEAAFFTSLPEQVSGAVQPVEASVLITGGNVFIRAGGNGIAAAENILVEGGAITVSNVSPASKKPISFQSSFTISGGTLIASGRAGTIKAPGSDSRQPSLTIDFSAPLTADNQLSIMQENGIPLFDFSPDGGIQSFLLSMPDLLPGVPYGIMLDDQTISAIVLQGRATAISIDNIN